MHRTIPAQTSSARQPKRGWKIKTVFVGAPSRRDCFYEESRRGGAHTIVTFDSVFDVGPELGEKSKTRNQPLYKTVLSPHGINISVNTIFLVKLAANGQQQILCYV